MTADLTKNDLVRAIKRKEVQNGKENEKYENKERIKRRKIKKARCQAGKRRGEACVTSEECKKPEGGVRRN